MPSAECSICHAPFVAETEEILSPLEQRHYLDSNHKCYQFYIRDDQEIHIGTDVFAHGVIKNVLRFNSDSRKMRPDIRQD